MFRLIRYVVPVISVATVFTPMLAFAGEVAHREMHQEQRILTGVKDGQVSTTEFQNLEHRELAINAQRVADLHRNDGHLTPQQDFQLNQRLNQLSNSIYQDRH